MSRLRATFVRLRSLFRKRQLDREMDSELSSHLELHIADNVRAGMTMEAARRDALLKLGGLEQTKENYRDRRGIAWLEALFRDLSFALRMLRKSPGFCIVAVLALALGIGSSSVVFSIFYNGVLHPFPYRDSDRLASPIIFDTRDGDRPFRGAFQLDEVVAFRHQNHTLEDIAAITGCAHLTIAIVGRLRFRCRCLCAGSSCFADRRLARLLSARTPGYTGRSHDCVAVRVTKKIVGNLSNWCASDT